MTEVPVTDEPSTGDIQYTQAQKNLFDADLTRRLQAFEYRFEDVVKRCLGQLRGYEGALRPRARDRVIKEMADSLEALTIFNEICRDRKYTEAYAFIEAFETAPAPEPEVPVDPEVPTPPAETTDGPVSES